MTPADRIHALAESLLAIPPGYLERSLALCSESELAALEAVCARAHLDRSLVRDSDPWELALRLRGS